MESIHIKPERETQMLQELANIAQRHVDSSGSQLEILPIDPDRYPAQRAYHIKGNPQSADVVESVATMAHGMFPELQKRLIEIEEKSQEIEEVGKLLEDGNNVLLVTNHGDLIDIALAEAALYSMLYKQDVHPRTGIIISKIISLMGARLGEDVAPAAEVLKLLCSDIYLTFPRTETMRRSALKNIIPDEINRHNQHMTDRISDALDGGGMLLAIAASGSVDKLSGEDTFSLETLSQGTSKMMMHNKTFVLPMAIWLRDDTPVFEICDIPRVLQEDASTHDVMELISRTLTENVEGKSFRYSPVRNLGNVAIESY